MPEHTNKNYDKRKNSPLSSFDFIMNLLDKSLITVDLFTGEIYKNFEPNSGRLDGYVNENGYIVIKITDPEHYVKNLYAHRIVYIAGNKSLPDFLVINHKNGIKTDNSLENLEAVPPRENCLHAVSMGLYSKKKTILTEEQRNEIIVIYSCGEYPIGQLAEMFSVNRRTVSKLLHKAGVPIFPPSYWNSKSNRKSE